LSFLLDTNVCSAHLRGRPDLTHRFIHHGGRLFIPTIVLAELYTWAYRRDDPAALLDAIGELLSEVRVLDYDEQPARAYGQLRGSLLRQGLPVDPVDLMISSVALVNDLTLVTHNTADFVNVPDLRLEDWLVA
jgi:tRNA(fMet)-specific endonuclease VapC